MNIAFIPVRGGSKGIPGKNIKLFSGIFKIMSPNLILQAACTPLCVDS